MTQNNINKRTYVKPSMKVYPLLSSARLLAGSETFPINPPESPTTDQW